MASCLQVENLTKSYGEQVLFENISFTIEEGRRVALVAKNGTGKTTLLNIIAGKESHDAGSVVPRRGLRIAYLEQSPAYPAGMTVLEACFHAANPALKAIAEYERAIGNASGEGLQEAMARMDALEAWDYEQRAKRILSRLRIRDFGQKVETLSGGQLKRVALANVLISESDMLILDEPTNHLDTDMTEWLEEYLTASGAGLLMVTHDRYFLDSVCSDILEMENRRIYHYAGNYSYYLEKKQERETADAAQRASDMNLYRRELEWMRRQPQARATKARSRIDAFHELESRLKTTRDRGEVRLDVGASRIGTKIFEARDVSKRFGDVVILDRFNYNFTRYEKLGIVGDNGCGKSTLMKIITGQIQPDSGNVEIGDTVHIGYFMQENEPLDENQTVLEFVRSIGEYVTTADGKATASQMCEKFLFTPKQQWTPISKLSGGEKRRLYLLSVLMSAPNVLILDEPTNDLDIETLEILEEYLDGFAGIVITVSHDRYFLDRVVDRIFAFEAGGHLTQYEGGYTDYRDKCVSSIYNVASNGVSDTSKSKAAGQVKKAYNSHEDKIKFTYMEQKEYETIDDDIEKLENRVSELDDEIAKNATSYSKLAELTKEKEDVERQLEEKMERWEYLNDLAEKIEKQKQ